MVCIAYHHRITKSRACQPFERELMERFGEKLRTLRMQNRLSYRQLATRLETAHSHIINIENGKHKPSVDLIVRIVQLFDISFDQLMDDAIELDLDNEEQK